MNEGEAQAQSVKRPIRFFDLFGGIGGFRLGLEKANEHLSVGAYERTSNERERTDENASIGNNGLFRCVGYCDFDKYAVECYNANFSENHAPTNARKLDESNLPEFDLLCAGFPCQPFSLAGKRRAFADEERGTLFHEIARILEVRKPDFVLLENVKGLLSAQRGYCFAFILSRLDELRYDVCWEVLNSKNFGVPQNRERVFIFGSRKRGGRQVFPIGQSGSVLEEANGREQESETVLKEITTKMPDAYRVYSSEGVARTLKGESGGVGGKTGVYAPCLTEEQGRQGSSKEFLSACEKINLSTGCLRRLTPVECERLQGFPDGWTAMLSDSRRYKCLGNAVTVNVVEAVGERILEAVWSE